MAVEMRSGEERRRVVLHQCLLVSFGRNPEDDHIRIALPRLGINGIWPRVAEEDERLATHLVDRVVAGPGIDSDMRHRQRKLVHVLDPGWPALVLLHAARVGGARA